ncbi:zinc-dependent alcohol dehydrogenase [Actinoplanes sp. RD1]|uniref:zinc-dependent alcohol dehydrogenase n=1 Tax=Actinoplanes sp. RD1 TaxID=3064538 RepID=UPI0027405EFC|nr:alcohol dehydrogenase catalytic domain-containing protein [Actinoplanes sp. RD1]
MLAVRNTGAGIEAVTCDAPSGSGVRLRVASAGICGSDLAFAAMGRRDYTYGHEIAGTTDDGRAWAVAPLLYCGACPQCASGHIQRCQGEAAAVLGISRDGGMAEEIIVPEYMLIPVPAGLPVTDGCLVEPGSVAWHGIRRAAPVAGERVAVVGGGTVGLLAAAAARRMGLTADIETRYAHQARAAEKLGAGLTDGEYDVVVDAAGSPGALARCAELAKPGGRVVILGVYFDTAVLPGPTSLMKELTYINAMAYDHREFADVAAMLADRPEIVEAVVTHRFPLTDAAEAFRVAGDRSAGAIKVVMHP